VQYCNCQAGKGPIFPTKLKFCSLCIDVWTVTQSWTRAKFFGPGPTRPTQILTRPDPTHILELMSDPWPDPTRPKARIAVSNHRISLAKMTYCNLANVLFFHYDFYQKHHKNCKIHIMHLRYFDPTRPDPTRQFCLKFWPDPIWGLIRPMSIPAVTLGALRGCLLPCSNNIAVRSSLET